MGDYPAFECRKVTSIAVHKTCVFQLLAKEVKRFVTKEVKRGRHFSLFNYRPFSQD
jgi:hypothetical protein